MDSRPKEPNYDAILANLKALKEVMKADYEQYTSESPLASKLTSLTSLTSKYKEKREEKKKQFAKSLDQFVVAAREAMVEIMLRLESGLKENESRPKLNEGDKAILSIIYVDYQELYSIQKKMAKFYHYNLDPLADESQFNTAGFAVNQDTNEPIDNNETRAKILKYRKKHRQMYTMQHSIGLRDILEYSTTVSLPSFQEEIKKKTFKVNGNPVVIKSNMSYRLLPEEAFWLHLAEYRWTDQPNILHQISKCIRMIRTFKSNVKNNDVDLVQQNKPTQLNRKLEKLYITTLINLSKSLINNMKENKNPVILKTMLYPSSLIKHDDQRTLEFTIEYLLEKKQDQLAQDLINAYTEYCKNMNDEKKNEVFNALQSSYDTNKNKYNTEEVEDVTIETYEENQITESNHPTPENVKAWEETIGKFIQNKNTVFKVKEKDLILLYEFQAALKKQTSYYQEKFYEIISKTFDDAIKNKTPNLSEYNNILEEMAKIAPEQNRDYSDYPESISVLDQLSRAARMLKYYSPSNVNQDDASELIDSHLRVKRAPGATCSGTSQGLPDVVTAIKFYLMFYGFSDSNLIVYSVQSLMGFYEKIKSLKSNEYFISDKPRTLLQHMIEQLKEPLLHAIDTDTTDYKTKGRPKQLQNFYDITLDVLHSLMKYYYENNDIDSVVNLHRRCSEYFSFFKYKKHLDLIFEIDQTIMSKIENPNEKMAYIDKCLNNPDKKRFDKYLDEAIGIAKQCNKPGKALQYLVQIRHLYYDERMLKAIDEKIKEVCGQLIKEKDSDETQASLREILLKTAVKNGFTNNEIHSLEMKYNLFSKAGLINMMGQVNNTELSYYFSNSRLHSYASWSLPSLYQHAMNKTTPESEPNDPVLKQSQFEQYGKEYQKRRILMEMIMYKIPDNAAEYEKNISTEYKNNAMKALKNLVNNVQLDFNSDEKTSGFNTVCRSLIESTDGINFNSDTFHQKLATAQLTNEIFRDWLKNLDLSHIDEKNVILNILKTISEQPQQLAYDSAKAPVSFVFPPSHNPEADEEPFVFPAIPSAPPELVSSDFPELLSSPPMDINNNSADQTPESGYFTPPHSPQLSHGIGMFSSPLRSPEPLPKNISNHYQTDSDSILNQRQTDYKLATISLKSLDDDITKLKDKIEIAKNQIRALEKERNKYINKKEQAKDPVSIERYKKLIENIISNIEGITRETAKLKREKFRVKIERVKKETEVKTLESKIRKKP